jgi:hypothetical protein
MGIGWVQGIFACELGCASHGRGLCPHGHSRLPLVQVRSGALRRCGGGGPVVADAYLSPEALSRLPVAGTPLLLGFVLAALAIYLLSGPIGMASSLPGGIGVSEGATVPLLAKQGVPAAFALRDCSSAVANQALVAGRWSPWPVQSVSFLKP